MEAGILVVLMGISIMLAMIGHRLDKIIELLKDKNNPTP